MTRTKIGFLLLLLLLLFAGDFGCGKVWVNMGVPIVYFIRQVGAASAVSQGAASSVVLNKPSGTTQGDVLYASIWIDCQVVPPLATVPTPAGWTSLGFATQNGPNASPQYGLYMFRRISDGTDGPTYTFNFSLAQNFSMGAVTTYRGVDNVTPEDTAMVFSTGQVGGTTATATGVTTVTKNDYILATIVDASNADAITTPTGFSINWIDIDAVNLQVIAGYYLAQSLPGPTGNLISGNWTTGAYFLNAVVGIKPAH